MSVRPDVSSAPAMMAEPALDAGSRRLGQLADDDAGGLIAVPSPPNIAPDAGTPVIAEASEACRGRIGYVSPDGRCYFVFATPLNWHQSRDECQKVGGHLATIRTERERKFISRISFETENWIGLSNFGANSFSWITNEELTVTSWEPGAPRSALELREAAVVIRPDSGLWSDRPPTELHPGLCELSQSRAGDSL